MKHAIKDARIYNGTEPTYSFVPGTRVITISNAPLDYSITPVLPRVISVQDIIFIGNESNKTLIAATFSKENIVSVVGNVITFANTPTLYESDILAIDIDFGSVPTEALINEMNNDKVVVAKAISDKGQQSTYTDSSVQMAAKIRAISSSINVATTDGNPSNWHNLNEAVGAVNDVSYPYKYALLIPKGLDTVYLRGANQFTMSDRVTTTATGYYSFDKTRDEDVATAAFYQGKMVWMTDVVRIEAMYEGLVGNVNILVHVGETIMEAITAHNIASLAEATAKYGYNPVNYKEIVLISGNGDATPDALNGDSIITVTEGYEGNAGKSTRWIVFSSENSTPDHTFGGSIGDPAFTWVRKIIWLFIYNVSIQGLNMDGCWINKISFDETYRLTNGINDPKNNTYKFIQQNYQFRNNYIQDFRFPPFLETLNDVDKVLDLNQAAVFGYTHIPIVRFPTGIKSLINTLSPYGYGAFHGSVGVVSVEFPIGIKNITITSSFLSISSIQYFEIPDGLENLNLSGAVLRDTQQLNKIYLSNPSISFTQLSTSFLLVTLRPSLIFEIQQGWNWNFNPQYSLLSAFNTKTYILDKLVDKRKDGISDSTCSTIAGSNIVSFLNGNCSSVFHIGEQITPLGVTALTVASIDNDNQITATANASATASGVAYDINKTLTLSPTVKIALETDYGSTWADEYTAKGWTIA